MTTDPPLAASQLTAADLQATADGSLTLHSHRFGQTYGSVHGAEAQARQVFVGGTGVTEQAHPRILEIGFGIGQNLRATLAACGEQSLDYLAYEYDPVPVALLREVSAGAAGSEHPLWAELLSAWPLPVRGELSIGIRQQRVRVRHADVLQAELPQDWADAVYLDGFSPEANPELWSPDFLLRVAQALRPGGVVATYSAAGKVRRALQAAGLKTEKCPGPPGKREFLRAVRP